MISITTQLLTNLLGTVLTGWLSCEPIKVLVSLLIIGYVFALFVRLVKS